MIDPVINAWKQFVNQVGQLIKQWTRPLVSRLLLGSLADMTRSRADLVAENALLRQQLIILRRQVKRPQLTQPDRTCLVLLARCTRFWKQALHIVQPDTLVLATYPIRRPSIQRDGGDKQRIRIRTNDLGDTSSNLTITPKHEKGTLGCLLDDRERIGTYDPRVIGSNPI